MSGDSQNVIEPCPDCGQVFHGKPQRPGPTARTQAAINGHLQAVVEITNPILRENRRLRRRLREMVGQQRDQ